MSLTGLFQSVTAVPFGYSSEFLVGITLKIQLKGVLSLYMTIIISIIKRAAKNTRSYINGHHVHFERIALYVNGKFTI